MTSRGYLGPKYDAAECTVRPPRVRRYTAVGISLKPKEPMSRSVAVL